MFQEQHGSTDRYREVKLEEQPTSELNKRTNRKYIGKYMNSIAHEMVHERPRTRV